MIFKKLLIIAFLGFLQQSGFCQTSSKSSTTIMPGAYRMEVYLPYLKGKKVGVFANQTSMVSQTHLVDTLRSLGINIVKIFAPEHGFRGTAGAGEKFGNDTDQQTGIPIVSLYGKKVKPTTADLNDVDILVFDLQDVGVRFYTYLSSLQYFMEGAAENHKPLIILDRPNPNGFYVDGPVLEKEYKSFVGMQPVPVVYGMTIGEYARMIAGEKWISQDVKNIFFKINNDPISKSINPSLDYSDITIITCANYTHASRYELPVKPSPNLPSMHAIYMYPSTCFFEGTNLSEGRGTEHPFEYFGHPSLPSNLFQFTPQSTPAAKDPKLKNQLCYGWDITDAPVKPQLQLQWLLQAYRLFPSKDSFFIQPKSKQPQDYFFNKLAGNSTLMQQIISGKTEAQIRASWQPQLDAFKKIRRKYLLYDDVE